MGGGSGNEDEALAEASGDEAALGLRNVFERDFGDLWQLQGARLDTLDELLQILAIVVTAEIDQATQQATAALNARTKPWLWGRPKPKPRTLRRRFIYHL
jgi:hypothetical protein